MSRTHSLMTELSDDLASAQSFGRLDPQDERQEVMAVAALLRELQVHMGARDERHLDGFAPVIAIIDQYAHDLEDAHPCTCTHPESAHTLAYGCGDEPGPGAETLCQCVGQFGVSVPGHARARLATRAAEKIDLAAEGLPTR